MGSGVWSLKKALKDVLLLSGDIHKLDFQLDTRVGVSQTDEPVLGTCASIREMCEQDFEVTPAGYEKLLRKKTFYGGVIESACIAMATGYVVQLGMLCDDGVFKPACQLARPNQDLTTYPPANILRLVHDGGAHFDGFQPMDNISRFTLETEDESDGSDGEQEQGASSGPTSASVKAGEDLLANLIAAKQQRVADNVVMKARVHDKMLTDMDVGIRVNPNLTAMHGLSKQPAEGGDVDLRDVAVGGAMCNYPDCTLDAGLRDCISCGIKGMHHHLCAIKHGQEELSTQCHTCLPVGMNVEGGEEANMMENMLASPVPSLPSSRASSIASKSEKSQRKVMSDAKSCSYASSEKGDG